MTKGDGRDRPDAGEPSLAAPTASEVPTVHARDWARDTPPERVGPFVVEGELARGGMGVVYLARDERLARRVALKALPESFAGDAVRRARLEREARLLALVNHPGVATIYGLEQAGGRTFLVLEYVEGPTLRAHLAGGRLEVGLALRTCARIAAAVEAAHERGVVHRDLKPENVKVTPAGQVKVLDFGLAKVPGTDDLGAAPVAVLDDEGEHELTQEGVVMGTPGYMSPEQVRGEPEDRRADTWALGCITFECLAGERTWGRGTARARLQATRWHEPDWSLIPREVPEGVVLALRACLEKDLPRRLARAGELKAALEAGIAELEGRGPVVRAEARRGNLPRQLTSFLGRECELVGLASRLETPGLVTLMGPGGTGKTRLALEAARRGESGVEGGAWFVDLAPVASGVVAAAAAAMGVTESPGVPLQAQLEAHLGSRRVLIVLDNCEHLVEEAAEKAGELVGRCAGLTVLATSREALGVPGETVIEVVPLGVPGAGVVTVEEAGQHDAVRLWVERAKAADATFELGVDNVSAISEACRLLDGLPLAIELAAARTRSVPAERVVALLASGGDVGGGRRGGSARHRTLRGLIEWSHGLLSAQEAAAYRRMGVFAGGVPVEAVEAVVAGAEVEEREVIDLVARLVEKSLVAVESRGGEARYRLLETVKAHAREKLEEAGEGDAMRLRHVRWAQREAVRLQKHLEGADALKWSERACDLLDEAKAVVAWAPGAGEGDAALEVATAWGRGLRWSGKLGLGIALIEGGLHATPFGMKPESRIGGWEQLAALYHEVGSPQRALTAAAAGLREISGAGRTDLESRMQTAKLRALTTLGRLEEGRATLEILRAAPESCDPRVERESTRAQVTFLVAVGEREAAVSAVRATLGTLSDREVVGHHAATLELLAYALGILSPEAVACAEKACAIYSRLGRQVAEASTELYLGACHFAQGRLADARRHTQTAAARATRLGAFATGSRAMNNLAWIALADDDFQEALGCQRLALGLAWRARDEREIIRRLVDVAEVQSHLQQWERVAGLAFAARSVSMRLRTFVTTEEPMLTCERLIKEACARITPAQQATFSAAAEVARLESVVREVLG